MTQIQPWLSYWAKLTKKISIAAGDSVSESIYSKSELWSNLSQSDSVLWDGLINWLFELLTWLNNWVMVEYESIWLSFSGPKWLFFFFFWKRVKVTRRIWVKIGTTLLNFLITLTQKKNSQCVKFLLHNYVKLG